MNDKINMMSFKLSDVVLLILATYAVIGIFGSIFVGLHGFIHDISWMKWLAVIMMGSGFVVSIFNKFYEEIVEKPELERWIADKGLDRSMFRL